MPIPDLPLFKHRDTVVTPADQNQFVTQFENTMDTLSNDVIPALNLAITDINAKTITTTTARDEAEDARDISVAAKDEALTAVATLQEGAIDDTTIATNKAFSNQYIENNYYDKTEVDTAISEATLDINSLPNKPTPEDTDNLALQETGGLLKKLNWSNIKESLKSIFVTKPELVTITGTATFNGSTQEITMTGVGTITLALGDVIEVTGTANNNKLFTVESLVNDNNIIVNYEHRNTNPATFGKLINETATNCTIKLYNRAKDAPLGQGQYPVNVARTAGQGYKSQPNRATEVVSSFGPGRNIQMSSDATNWLTLSGNSDSGVSYWSIIVPPNFFWKTNTGSSYTTTEVR